MKCMTFFLNLWKLRKKTIIVCLEKKFNNAWRRSLWFNLLHNNIRCETYDILYEDDSVLLAESVTIYFCATFCLECYEYHFAPKNNVLKQFLRNFLLFFQKYLYLTYGHMIILLVYRYLISLISIVTKINWKWSFQKCLLL